VLEAHSVSAGLDYPGVGPEHSWLRDTQRVRYESVGDTDALDAFQLFTRLEGIIPALETSHAIAWIDRNRGAWTPDDVVLLSLSGRGDKDVAHVASLIGPPA
jgi:tryptophan synthase beta chain